MTFDVAAYWEARYASGGDSGDGSRGKAAQAKATFVNDLLQTHDVRSVIDWGCGDGVQLRQLLVPPNYVGVEVSPTALQRCITANVDRGLSFVLHGPLFPAHVFYERFEVALCLDVLFHLPREAQYLPFLRHLFASATRYVCVHTTNIEGVEQTRDHVRHRLVVADVAMHFPEWHLLYGHAESPEPDFYIWERQ